MIQLKKIEQLTQRLENKNLITEFENQFLVTKIQFFEIKNLLLEFKNQFFETEKLFLETENNINNTLSTRKYSYNVFLKFLTISKDK